MNVRIAAAAAVLATAALGAPANAGPTVPCVVLDEATGASTCRIRVDAVPLPDLTMVSVDITVDGPFVCDFRGTSFGGPAGGALHTTFPYEVPLDVTVDCTPLDVARRCNLVTIGLVGIGWGTAAGTSSCRSLVADCGVAVNASVDVCAAASFGFSRTPWRCTVRMNPNPIIIVGAVCTMG